LTQTGSSFETETASIYWSLPRSEGVNLNHRAECPGGYVRRREFITVVGGAAMWPLAARAQPEGMQRIGVLMGYDENTSQHLIGAFKQELAALGWIEDRNLHIDYRWTAGNVNRAVAFAKELVALQPKLIVSNTTPVTAALHRETKTIPLIFVVVSDPVGSGFVEACPARVAISPGLSTLRHRSSPSGLNC
jgi:hypothetical protein